MRERLPRRDPQLLLDEVDAGDELGDRVLDLQPRVHLDEEELVGAVGRDEELDGAGAAVVDARGGRAGGGAEARAGRGVDDRRRRLFDDLLVAALQRALALAEVDDGAVRVGEHLHLDVARALDEPLEQQRVVAERGGRDAARGRERLGQLGRRAHDLHALAAAARGGLDQQREARRRPPRPRSRHPTCPAALKPGHGRHAVRRRRAPSRGSCRP